MGRHGHFVEIAPSEVHTLSNPRRPHGLPVAAIQLGQLADGRWMKATEASLADRGHGEPLGHWSTNDPLAYRDRDAALEAAKTRILRTIERLDTPEANSVRRWLEGIASPPQPDLFGAAA